MVEGVGDRCHDGTPCVSPSTCKAQDDGFCLRRRRRERHQETKVKRGGEEEGET